MRFTTLSYAGLAFVGLCLTASAEGIPKIQFDQTVYDFGKISQVASVSGVFKFKNVGDGVLNLQPPKPSCGCTIAGLKPDILQPGQSGELSFTMNLGLSKAHIEKHISVPSNDPQNPDMSLTIMVEYTPLFDISPMALAPILAFGVNETNQFTTITRSDGKALGALKLVSSQAWITAKVEPNAQADDSSARIRVDIQRSGSPRRFNESIQVYTITETNTPVSTIFLSGQVLGEILFAPEVLYWSITDPAKIKVEQSDPLLTRRLTIRSADGKAFELKNPQSTLKDVRIELAPTEGGKAYELVAKLGDVPAKTLSGNVSFETSVAAQSRIEVPIIVNVFTP